MIRNIILNTKNPTREIWAVVNTLLTKDKTKNLKNHILLEIIRYKAVADCFADYFCGKSAVIIYLLQKYFKRELL